MRISQIDEWLRGVEVEELKKDEMRKLAVYKAYQEAIDSTLDMIAMMCKNVGIPPKDDYMNTEKLIEKGIIPKDIGEKILEANKLRNLLLHHYDEIDDDAACVSIKESLEWMLKFLDIAKKCLNNQQSR